MTAIAITGWALAALLAWACNRIWDHCDQRGQRIRQQNDAAINQTIQLEEVTKECDRLRAENTVIRAENVRHLQLAVQGRAS